MIYTVTLNPSLDYVVNVDKLTMGATNRSASDATIAGGKGINVSFLLKELGIESVAIALIAGYTGQEIRRRIEAKGVKGHFIELEEGTSRINVKIKERKETEINAQGPAIPEEKITELMDYLKEVLDVGDILILAGSIPVSVPKNIYREIAKFCQPKGVKVVVDAQGSVLHDVINEKPFLIKPNQDELRELFDVQVTTLGEANRYVKKLHEMGAKNAIVSLGEAGAILAAEDGKVYSCIAPRGNVVNTVGAGDSMIAGFITGLLSNIGYQKALELGVAAGSATAFAMELATKREIQDMFETVKKGL